MKMRGCRLLSNKSGLVAELADAGDLKSLAPRGVRVRLPPGPIEEEIRSRPAGLGPTTCGLEDRCSIQLSYRR